LVIAPRIPLWARLLRVGLKESVFRGAFLVFYVKQTISVHSSMSSMSSLADAPDLVGFFSYSREDDEDSGGKLSKLRERIQAELRGQLGRTKADFRLWQDKVAIAHGELWEDTIKKGISESVFFIPIITPTAVRSRFCEFEFKTFLAREKELGRSNLVFPILYISVPALADDRWRQDPLLETIGSRQYEQWQNLRHLDPSSTEVALRVEKLCENICKALQQPWLSPQQRQEAEAQRLAEEKRREAELAKAEAQRLAEEKRREAEAHRLAKERRREEEAQRLAEEKRREAEAQRLAEEKRREAEAQRLAKERRREAEAQRLAEEKRREEEAQRLAEEKRREEEAQRLAEEKRREAEAQRLAKAEAQRLAEEKRREAEAQRLAKAEAQRLAKEKLAKEKRREAEAQRLREETRQEAEAQRLAKEKRREEEAQRLAEETRREAESPGVTALEQAAAKGDATAMDVARLASPSENDELRRGFKFAVVFGILITSIGVWGFILTNRSEISADGFWRIMIGWLALSFAFCAIFGILYWLKKNRIIPPSF
jgi:hypothetical protein